MMVRVLILMGVLSMASRAAVAQADPVPESEDAYNHSMFVEPNLVDTQYSVLFEPITFSRRPASDPSLDHIPFGWWPYDVKARVVEVYKGSFSEGETLDLLIYLTAPLSRQSPYRESPFLFSFCRSEGGIHYNSRDFLLLPANEGNVGRFRQVHAHGTDYQGSGDCSGNYPSLNPDTHHDD